MVLRISYLYGFNMIRFDGLQFISDVNTSPAAVYKEVRGYAKYLLESFVAPYGYSAAEMASWPELMKEIRAYEISNDPDDAPLCKAEAEASNLSMADVIARVAANGAAYQLYLTAVKGARNKHLLALSQLTGDDANDYDWRLGWPVI